MNFLQISSSCKLHADNSSILKQFQIEAGLYKLNC